MGKKGPEAGIRISPLRGAALLVRFKAGKCQTQRDHQFIVGAHFIQVVNLSAFVGSWSFNALGGIPNNDIGIYDRR